jgi:hypothetical protein
MPAHILRSVSATERPTMTVSEDQRFLMHQELRKVLGDDVGNTVMEHLPPLGWGDVARTKDINHLADRMTQIDQRLTGRIDGVEERMSMRIDYVETRLKSITTTLQVMIGAMVTVSTGIIVMLIQIHQNITSL